MRLEHPSCPLSLAVEGELFLPVKCQTARARMNRVTGVVDVYCLAAGTGAGVKLWDWSASWSVPEDICLLLFCLFSRVRGCTQRGVFEPGSNGLAPGVSVRGVAEVPVCGGKGRKRIRPFPFVGLYQIEEATLL